MAGRLPLREQHLCASRAPCRRPHIGCRRQVAPAPLPPCGASQQATLLAVALVLLPPACGIHSAVRQHGFFSIAARPCRRFSERQPCGSPCSHPSTYPCLPVALRSPALAPLLPPHTHSHSALLPAPGSHCRFCPALQPCRCPVQRCGPQVCTAAWHAAPPGLPACCPLLFILSSLPPFFSRLPRLVEIDGLLATTSFYAPL